MSNLWNYIFFHLKKQGTILDLSKYRLWQFYYYVMYKTLLIWSILAQKEFQWKQLFVKEPTFHYFVNQSV